MNDTYRRFEIRVSWVRGMRCRDSRMQPMKDECKEKKRETGGRERHMEVLSGYICQKPYPLDGSHPFLPVHSDHGNQRRAPAAGNAIRSFAKERANEVLKS